MTKWIVMEILQPNGTFCRELVPWKEIIDFVCITPNGNHRAPTPDGKSR